MSVADTGVLGDLIDKAEKQVGNGKPISIALVQQIAGRRSAGPLLLFPALLAMSPLTVVPGIATLVGLCALIVATQVAFGREDVWLPRWLRRLTLPPKHTAKLLKYLKPIGEKADQVVQKRATFLTSWPLRRIGAAICALIGLLMPITEVVPFTATWCGAAIAAYGLAITARDGFLAMAWAFFIAALILIAAAMLF